jgi:creatinine amidohydrolase
VTVRLDRVAWPTLAALDPDRTLLVVPVGSTEQHGPHLPLDTDTRVATAVASAAAASLDRDGPVVLAPPVAFGASGEHQHFPGTVSVGTAVARDVVVELARSATSWAARVLLVNGHGGNVEALTAAATLLVTEGRDVAWVPALAVRPGDVPGPLDAHAGRTETSLLLHLAPEVVDLAAARPGRAAAAPSLMAALRAGGVRAFSPNGVLGDPTGASAGEGAVLFAAAVGGVLRRARAWRRDGAGRLADPDPQVAGPAAAGRGRAAPAVVPGAVEGADA